MYIKSALGDDAFCFYIRLLASKNESAHIAFFILKLKSFILIICWTTWWWGDFSERISLSLWNHNQEWFCSRVFIFTYK